RLRPPPRVHVVDSEEKARIEVRKALLVVQLQCHHRVGRALAAKPQADPCRGRRDPFPATPGFLEIPPRVGRAADRRIELEGLSGAELEAIAREDPLEGELGTEHEAGVVVAVEYDGGAEPGAERPTAVVAEGPRLSADQHEVVVVVVRIVQAADRPVRAGEGGRVRRRRGVGDLGAQGRGGKEPEGEYGGCDTAHVRSRIVDRRQAPAADLVTSRFPRLVAISGPADRRHCQIRTGRTAISPVRTVTRPAGTWRRWPPAGTSTTMSCVPAGSRRRAIPICPGRSCQERVSACSRIAVPTLVTAPRRRPIQASSPFPIFFSIPLVRAIFEAARAMVRATSSVRSSSKSRITASETFAR